MNSYTFASPSTRLFLAAAGWDESRSVDTSGYEAQLTQGGFPVFAAFRQVMRSFGGLEVRTDLIGRLVEEHAQMSDTIMFSQNEHLLRFDPALTQALGEGGDRCQALHAVQHLKIQIAPVGLCYYHSPTPFDLLIASNGLVFAGSRVPQFQELRSPRTLELMWAGDDIAQALDNIITFSLAYT